MSVQAPRLPETLQDLQVPLQAVSQQVPSTQRPLLQVADEVQAWPLASLQAPLPSQTFVPVQGLAAMGSGFPAGMWVQLPRLAERAQDLQVSVQSEAQQTLSTQNPVAQSPARVQAWPVAFLQAPAPSQALVPVQGVVALVSCCPTGMLAHVPWKPDTAQDWQTPVQEILQQKVSAQKPVAHSVDPEQAWPLAFLQTPLPSQAWVPAQAPVG